ncbi:MAG: ATP-dependent RecD-like DNA helicase, partial [Ruminococcus sp.]|nr:ATP-dependent RecD-like DNA helicase [Ruminococcus sp.]
GEIELAYALTIHVTQGSGYDNVIVLIDNSHFKLLDSCLLYTAVTRAKKRCLLIAEPSAFEKCINSKASERKTWLLLESRCM